MKSKMIFSLRALILLNLQNFKSNKLNTDNSPMLIKLLAVKAGEDEKKVFELCEKLEKENLIEIVNENFARIK